MTLLVWWSKMVQGVLIDPLHFCSGTRCELPDTLNQLRTAFDGICEFLVDGYRSRNEGRLVSLVHCDSGIADHLQQVFIKLCGKVVHEILGLGSASLEIGTHIFGQRLPTVFGRYSV